MLQRFLVLWLALLSGVAVAWPQLTTTFDPFVASRGQLPWLIALIMLSVGSMLPADEVRQLARRWPLVLCGTALQYTSMPLLAWCVARAVSLDEDLTIGLMMVGCVPGAMASNVLTYLARGNTSYSVSLTTAATLLSPLVVPLVMKLALAMQGEVQLDALEVSLSLLATVVLPVVSGYLLSQHVGWWQRLAERYASTVANLLILWLIAIVVGLNRDRLVALNATLLVALLGINVGGYLLGYGGAAALRMPEGMRRALTLEIGMQNAGLGATLAAQLFPDRPAAAIPPALYMFGCMLTGTLLAHVWSRWPPRE